VEKLLEKLAGVEGPALSREQVAALRALEVLEKLGTPEAQQVLEKLARGPATDRLTQEAKASVERLLRRR
jgi:hypothetical protein